MRLRLALALATFAGLAACTADTRFDPIESASIRPEDVYVFATLVSNGAQVTFDGDDFYFPERTHPLALTAGDQYILRAPDAPDRQLGSVGGRWYGLLRTSAPSIQFVFHRTSGDFPVDVTMSTFTITPPSAPISRASPITLNWDVSTVPTRVSLTVWSSCGPGFSRYVAKDTGSFTFYPGDFGVVSGTCAYQVSVSRSSTVLVDFPIHAQFYVDQSRTITLETTP